MKAPDKIYISHHYKQPIDYGFFKTENAEPYTVEYIRKDALLEMLLTMEARHSVFYLEGKIVREIINKISLL